MENQTEPPPESPENPSHSVPHKKTRDLPNLTECHACSFKVDVCTGKNRLQTLYSEWRVVLLCNKCFSSVESSRICSYCFSESTPDSFRCIQCRHSVHRNCFLKSKNSAPWSYSCLGSEFSLCVDCWIPKSVTLSRRRRRIGVRSEMINKKGSVMLEKESSKILEGGNLVRSIEDMVKDANRVVEKKVEAAARAREEAIKKAAAARSAVMLANNALSLVANRKDSNLDLPQKRDALKGLDASELTFELHSHLNRISKSCCLLKTSCLDIPQRASSVDSSCKTSNSMDDSACDKLEASDDNKIHEDSSKSLCEPSVYMGSSDRDSSTDLNGLCTGRSDMKTHSRDGLRTSECDVVGGGEDLLKEGEGSCSDQLINFGEDSGMKLDCKPAGSALHGEEGCNRLPDRYFFKYSRKNRSIQQVLHCPRNRYFFKYSRRNVDRKPKIHDNKIYLGCLGSTVGVPFNCFVELRATPNASCQSFNAHLQASACESGYFRESS